MHSSHPPIVVNCMYDNGISVKLPVFGAQVVGAIVGFKVGLAVGVVVFGGVA